MHKKTKLKKVESLLMERSTTSSLQVLLMQEYMNVEFVIQATVLVS